jgi:hypothetical protein
MKIEFNTVEFEFSHGRKPKGRGSWAFSGTRNPRIEDVFFSPSMTYSEAKRWFVAKLKAEGVTGNHVAYVQS